MFLKECVCVRERGIVREREREREREGLYVCGKRERQKERKSMCAGAWEREKECAQMESARER